MKEREAKSLWKDLTDELLPAYGKDEAESIAGILLEDCYGVSKADLLSGTKVMYDPEELSSFVGRIQKREPIQYVTGKAAFYGRFFDVEPGVLIPRPETEELVQLVIQLCATDSPKILEVGIGSGCIAITLACELGIPVMGTDVSTKALEVAARNADALGAAVDFYEHDILSKPLAQADLDVLVSNPPYIPAAEKLEMDRNVTDFEPDLALFVPNHDPLVFYRRIAEEGGKALKLGGRIFFEIHEKHGNQVKELLEELAYKEVTVHQDMQGKDRMVVAQKL